MVTVAHEIDCADRVEIGDYSSLAGFRCTILTHSLNLVRDRFVTGAVEIGPHAAVMSGSTLLSGTKVPARSIVSAHSVVNTPLDRGAHVLQRQPGRGGPHPARDLGFFHRGEASSMPSARRSWANGVRAAPRFASPTTVPSPVTIRRRPLTPRPSTWTCSSGA